MVVVVICDVLLCVLFCMLRRLAAQPTVEYVNIMGVSLEMSAEMANLLLKSDLNENGLDDLTI
jgi:hypothetical protein